MMTQINQKSSEHRVGLSPGAVFREEGLKGRTSHETVQAEQKAIHIQISLMSRISIGRLHRGHFLSRFLIRVSAH